ncbi:MAG: TIGR03790 family protein [Bryobacteraceae bacterium]
MPTPTRLLLLLLLAEAALAATPDRILLVVNRNSPASREIGDYYARRRQIPPRNICQIRTSTNEEIDREVYEREIAPSVSKCLQANGLSEQILYIVTTLGIPLKIRGTSGQEGNAAAVDSELTLLYRRLQGETHPVDGFVLNPFFRRLNAPFRHPDFPIYLVTRLAAYDVAGVKALIDRAIEARNRGKAVIDLNADDDSPGNSWLRDAAIRLPKDRVIFDASPDVLYEQKDVIAYASWGSNDKNRKERWLNFEWLPGAIATEFVSSNGRTFQRPPSDWNLSTWNSADRPKWFAGSPQSLTADLIEEGATGASGHVYEPYLGLSPRPEILLPAYLGGRNLAESFYLAIPALSWQNIVIGDPLCRLQ